MRNVATGAGGLAVGEVARLAGITVRALHHYDEIGLVQPSARTSTGHRRYGSGDLERLARVLCYRELDLPLDEIARLLAVPAPDRATVLREQHRLLRDRIARLERVAAGVHRAVEAWEMGIHLEPHELVEVFGDEDPTRHRAEAEQRWGDSEAWQESARRTARYDKDDWLAMRAEGDAVEASFAEAMAAGEPPDGAVARQAAESHRRHIERWFYPCPAEQHRGLAELYTSDERFAAYYDRRAPGLARYVAAAITANAS